MIAMVGWIIQTALADLDWAADSALHMLPGGVADQTHSDPWGYKGSTL